MTTIPQLRAAADEPAEENDEIGAPGAAEDRHPEYEEVFGPDEETAWPVIVVVPAASTFVYEVGHRVQPEASAPARHIIWRGHLKERLPETGWVHRVNVYRLDDGFWDCYREDELQAA
jgi:hypothetical protein